MLRTAKSLKGFKIHATDGDIGKVEEFLFDDSRWVVRYLGVKTGGWLNRKEVLLTPLAIREVNWHDRTIEVTLTREQVENSPPIETDQPVSRQKETEYFDYYRLPYYWTGAGIFGIGPTGVPAPNLYEIREEAYETHTGDPHLRSSGEIVGYDVVTQNIPCGKIEDLILDDHDWTIRYLMVDKGTLEKGHTGLVSPAWVDSFSWEERQVRLDLSAEQLEAAPAFESIEGVNREYEERLHSHYQRKPYWTEERIGRIQEGIREATWPSALKRPDQALADEEPRLHHEPHPEKDVKKRRKEAS